LQDKRGVRLAQSEPPPRLADFHRNPARALKNDYFKLPSPDGERILTVQWLDNIEPDDRQIQILTQLTARLAPGASTGIRQQRPEKDVQARINQVQRATLQLRELRRLIDASLANMADGVVVVNTIGQVVLSNTRAAWYLRNDDDAELNGQQVNSLLRELKLEHGDDDWATLMRRSLLQGERLQASVRHHSGRDLLVQIAPLHTDGAGSTGLIFNFSDISPLKASERKRNELLNFLSHDLRSPLVSMSALIDLARGPRADLGALLNRMEAYTDNTLELAEQFLQLARAESIESFNFREIDIIGVATNALERVWGQAHSKSIGLRQAYAPDQEIWILGDGSLLERALVNLLDNAIKYSEPNTVVKLDVQRGRDQILCCVSDQGAGIAADQVPHLFERFHRVAGPGTAAQRGAGLGLAFVDVVARQHGGRVSVDSEPGRGSRFCLLLPPGPTD